MIMPDGAYPEDHEIATARVFVRLGYDVEFVVPMRTRGSHAPDIEMTGVLWEMKSPTGNGKRTLDDAVKEALRQSCNVILDWRRTTLDDQQTIGVLKNNKNILRGVKRLKFIKKDGIMVDIKK